MLCSTSRGNVLTENSPFRLASQAKSREEPERPFSWSFRPMGRSAVLGVIWGICGYSGNSWSAGHPPRSRRTPFSCFLWRSWPAGCPPFRVIYQRERWEHSCDQGDGRGSSTKIVRQERPAGHVRQDRPAGHRWPVCSFGRRNSQAGER